MQNFQITIAYDGSRYHGWQRLKNEQTIQGKIEGVLSEMLGHQVEIHGAGRTDAGVHARAQTAHFKVQTDCTPEDIAAYLYRYLPEDIAITGCTYAEERFHARLNAAGKRYQYRIWNSNVPNVFERKYLYRMEDSLNVDRMQQGAAYLVGRHDFRAFCGNKKMKKSTVRTLYRADVEKIGCEVRMTFEATGFLQNMVRILAGTLMEVGLGKRQPCDVLHILDSGERENAGITMPPQGLVLDKVFYGIEWEGWNGQ